VGDQLDLRDVVRELVLLDVPRHCLARRTSTTIKPAWRA